ncbi:hypothetical protein E4T56_gene3812, partial [Termitomyces sp. T112]
VAILRESLTAAERDKGILAIRLAESETRTQKYCFEAVEQRRAADIELQSQRSANRELEGRVEASLTRISALDQEVQALQQSKSAADTLLFEARSQRTLASAKLQEAEARNELLTSQLTINTDENSELQAVLNVYKDLVITLYTQFSTTAMGEQDAIPLLQQVSIASTLESELALAKQSTDDLTTKLAAIMDERAKILCELDKAQATISS